MTTINSISSYNAVSFAGGNAERKAQKKKQEMQGMGFDELANQPQCTKKKGGFFKGLLKTAGAAVILAGTMIGLRKFNVLKPLREAEQYEAAGLRKSIKEQYNIFKNDTKLLKDTKVIGDTIKQVYDDTANSLTKYFDKGITATKDLYSRVAEIINEFKLNKGE